MSSVAGAVVISDTKSWEVVPRIGSTMMLKLVVGRSAEVIEYCSQHEYKAKWKEQRTGNEGILGKTRRVGFFFLFGSYLLADAGIIETKKSK